MKTFKLFNLLLYVFFIYEFTTTNLYANVFDETLCSMHLCSNSSHRDGCYETPYDKDPITHYSILLPAGFYGNGNYVNNCGSINSFLLPHQDNKPEAITSTEISVTTSSETYTTYRCYSYEAKHIEQICYIHSGAFGDCPFEIKCEDNYYWVPGPQHVGSAYSVGSCHPCKWNQKNNGNDKKYYTMTNYGKYRLADGQDSSNCQLDYNHVAKEESFDRAKIDNEIGTQITCSYKENIKFNAYLNLSSSPCEFYPIGELSIDLDDQGKFKSNKIEIPKQIGNIWYKKFKGFSTLCNSDSIILFDSDGVPAPNEQLDSIFEKSDNLTDTINIYAVWTNHTYSTYTLKVDGGENKTIQKAGCEIDPNKPCKIEITNVIQAGKEISEENITISINGSNSSSEVPGLKIQTNDNKTTLSITPNEDLFKKCLDSKCTATVTLGYSECPKGYYCTQGIKHPCPIGTTTNETGKSSITDCKMMTGENGTILKDNYGKFYLPGNGSYIGIKQN